MKILVTGGAGFIGSEFVRQGVKNGLEMIVIDNLTYAGDVKRLEQVWQKIKFIQSDITDKNRIKEIFKNEKPEIIVHFAAETHVDRSILEPELFIRTNIYGTFCLLEEARNLDGIEKFIHVSTDEIYGELGDEGKFIEETCPMPSSPYSSSKASADMLVRSYQHTFSLPAIIVRPSNNYGPWQYPEKLIPVVIIKALMNEYIPVYGQGLNIREWLYVEDCNNAIFSITEKGRIGEVYNIGSGIEKRNIEVVRAILQILNKPDSLIQFVKDRPGHDYRYSLNTEKTEKEIGWKAKTDFDIGIEKTVKWYLENKDWLMEKATALSS